MEGFKKIIIFFLLFFFFFINLAKAESSFVKVSPVIIDQKAKIRDVLEYKITIKNDKNQKATIYPLVSDVSVENGKQEIIDPSLLDRSTSLSRWIRITRARIVVMPHQQIEIPLKIEIDPEAKIGKYYALITFSPGSSEPQAKENAKKFNQPQVLVGIEIIKNQVHWLQLNKIDSSKKVYFFSPVKFFIEIENIGNQIEEPKGEIIIYNKKQETVKEVSLNGKFGKLLPKEKKKIILNWPFKDGLGKYKARLYISYGPNDQKDLNDSIYFWIFPIKFISLIVGGVFFGLLFLVISLYGFFRKRFIKNFYFQEKPENKEKSDIDLNKLY